MELRKRKWIYNQLPKYRIGKPATQVGAMAGSDGTTAAQIATKNSLALPSSYNAPSFGYDEQVGSDLSQVSNIKSREWVNDNVQRTLNEQNIGDRASNAAPQIATNLLNFTGSVINANTLGRSTGEIMADAGSRYVNTGEFSWQRQNEINGAQEMSDLHKQHVSNTLSAMGTGAALGASIGSIFPGAGTAIGAVGGAIVGGIAGLLGGGKTHAQMRKRIYNAQQQRLRNNNFNFASAQGEWLNQQYDLNHAYTQDGQIYVAKYGKACGGLMKRK